MQDFGRISSFIWGTADLIRDPEYLAFLLASSYGRAYFTSTSRRSTSLASTSSSKIKQFEIPLPSPSSQAAIVRHLLSINEKHDALVSASTRAIERLQEYRAALISAAVTGQIDVRNEV